MSAVTASVVRAVRTVCAAVAAVVAVAITSAAAQPITTNDAVARLFHEEIQADWFDDAFLAQVPVQQLNAVIGALTSQFGPLVEVTGEGGQLTTRLEGATMATQIVLDAEGRIAGLFFGPPVPVETNLDDLIADIAALPGETSVLVLTNGEVTASLNPEAPLAVGSAFKLAVLAALTNQVAAGNLSWDDVVAFDPAWRSLPTGILQSWPEGTPLTLATLANLMISISDNTATDALIAVVGRETVEAVSPRNTPFLTTGELFRLKSRGHDDLAAAWLAAEDEAARRAIVAQLDALALPSAAQLQAAPNNAIEWHFTAGELCALLAQVSDNPAFAINAGVADAGDWAHVAFKGGSEAGVLNLSTLVTAADGTMHCVVATWNDDATLDDQALITPYAGILAALARGEAAQAPPPAAPANSAAYADGLITVPVPADFALVTPPAMPVTDTVIPPCDANFDACLVYAGGAFDGTNFEVAGMRILRRGDLATKDACLTTQPDGYSGIVPVTATGAGYATSVFAGLGDGGAGHYASGVLYRLAVEGACYEFETRIGETAFANYDPGTIGEFTDADRDALRAAFAAIVNAIALADGEPVNFPAPAGF